MPIASPNITPDVSAVIVNYNAGKWLLSTIAAALTQVQQIVVVDNASQDDSLSLVESQYVGDKRIVILRSASNQGFAAGCNRGAHLTTTPFILFLNPDCALQADSVCRLTKVLKYNYDVGMVGGLLVDQYGVEQRGGRRSIPKLRHALPNLLGLSRFFGDFNLHRQPLPSEPIEIEAISGALMLVRREALMAVGYWDEGYFLHCEDLDLCMQFRQKGWRVLFVPDAIAVHVQGLCSRSRPIFVSWHKHKGMIRFHKKFFSDHYSPLLMWTITFGIWGRFGMVVIRHFLLHRIHRYFKDRYA